MSKTAFVTGVVGQVGSYMADFLLERDYRVIGLKRRSASGSNWRIENALKNKNFELIEGDITDYSSVLNILSYCKPDEIYNFAAQSHVKSSFDQPSYTFDVNTKGVLNILEVMKFLNSKARLYQSSTSEMYGSNYDKDPNTHIKYQDENTNFCPNSPYAASKLAAHNLIKLYRESYGLWVVGGIMFNTESPRRHVGFVTRKITSWAKNEMCNHKQEEIKKPLRLGNMNTLRDWSYAQEAVEAIYLILQNTSPKEYVIGTGETHSISEFLTEVINYWRGEYNWITARIDTSLITTNVELYKRPHDVPYLKSDPSLIFHELGWKAKTKFKDLVRIMCEKENGKN